MEKEKNYLNDAKELLDYDNLVQILKVKYLTTAKEGAITIETKTGKTIRVFRYNGVYNSGIVIKCSDGREMNISSDCFRDYITVSYKIFEDASLEFNFSFAFSDMWLLRDGKIDGENLESRLIQTQFYTKNNNGKFRYIGSNKVKVNDYDYLPFLEIEDNYIWAEARYELSSDCENLLTINDEKVPPKEIVMAFNEYEEKDEFEKIISNSSLNSDSKKELLDNFDLSETSEYYEEIVNVYEREIPSCKRLVEFMNILSNNKLQEYMFSNEEMEIIVDYLKDTYNIDTKETNKRKVLGR
jgi:hypothetical protein